VRISWTNEGLWCYQHARCNYEEFIIFFVRRDVTNASVVLRWIHCELLPNVKN
jgi:hypothetical protein